MIFLSRLQPFHFLNPEETSVPIKSYVVATWENREVEVSLLNWLWRRRGPTVLLGHFRKPGIPYIAASRTLLKGRELSNDPTIEFCLKTSIIVSVTLGWFSSFLY